MRQDDRLCVLADSLPAAIRWRFSDYEELLKKELRMLAAPLRSDTAPRNDDNEPSRLN